MSSPRQMFAGSPLKKASEKSTETIEKHGEKQVQTLKSLEFLSKESPSIKTFISEKMIYPETMNELENIRKQKQKIDKKKLYRGFKTIFDFGKFKTMPSSRDAIRNNIITMDMANDEQDKLAKKIK